jgi:hypothetical protein
MLTEQAVFELLFLVLDAFFASFCDRYLVFILWFINAEV